MIRILRRKGARSSNLEDLKRLDEFGLHCHSDEVMIIGGARFIDRRCRWQAKCTLPDRCGFEGDTYFPEWDEREWELCEQIDGTVDEKNVYPHQFLVYRIRQGLKNGTCM